MGNIATSAGRKLIRKTRRFNVENRAQRFIEQEKLPVAPKHPSTVEILESLSTDPKVREELMRKNTGLDENLKQVYVKSLHKSFTNDDEREKLLNSKLPKEKGNVPEMKYGHTEPIVVPKGKYSLGQVIDMLSDHMNDPMENTPQALADRYSLDVKLVESLILYFRLFKVETTAEETSQRLLAREKMSSFAKVQEYMSKQTILKIAETFNKNDKDYEELMGKQRAEGDDLQGGTADVTKSSHIADDNKEAKTTKSHEEEYSYEVEEDDHYKKVGSRKKKKTT